MFEDKDNWKVVQYTRMATATALDTYEKADQIKKQCEEIVENPEETQLKIKEEATVIGTTAAPFLSSYLAYRFLGRGVILAGVGTYAYIHRENYQDWVREQLYHEKTPYERFSRWIGDTVFQSDPLRYKRSQEENSSDE